MHAPVAERYTIGQRALSLTHVKMPVASTAMRQETSIARAPRRCHDPTSTGAAKAVGLCSPSSTASRRVAIRVPTPNVSVVDFKFIAKRATTKDEVNGAVRRAAEQQLKAFRFHRPAQCVDRLHHDPALVGVPHGPDQVMDGTLVRVMSWYDKRMGFLQPQADTAVAMGKLI